MSLVCRNETSIVHSKAQYFENSFLGSGGGSRYFEKGKGRVGCNRGCAKSCGVSGYYLLIVAKCCTKLTKYFNKKGGVSTPKPFHQSTIGLPKTISLKRCFRCFLFLFNFFLTHKTTFNILMLVMSHVMVGFQILNEVVFFVPIF